MKTFLLAAAIAAVSAAPAVAQCAFGMAHVSKGKPVEHLAMTPVPSSDTVKEFRTASLTDGWLVKYLDQPLG